MAQLDLKIKTPTTVRQIQSRLRRIIDQAHADQIALGRDWYPNARAFARELHQQYPQYSYTQVAGVIAVLSPTLRWTVNKARSVDYLRQHAAGQPATEWAPAILIGANMRKAEAILNGDLSVITGPKVTAFYANILGDESRVTVDQWHTLAALGVKRQPTRVQRRLIHRATVNLARQLGMTAAATQAVIWVSLRGSPE